MEKTLNAFYKKLDQFYAAGGQEKTEQFLLEWERRLLDEGSWAELVAVYNELGSFYRGTSRYEQSLSSFQQAEEEIARRLGKNCTEYATVLNNMAGTYRLARQREKAVSLFQEAIQIYLAQEKLDIYACASVYNNISLVLQDMGELDRAAGYLEQALELISQMPQCRHEMAVTYNNLTALYHRAGREEEAKRCLELALQSFEQCSEEENVHYAAGLNSLAGFLYSAGDYGRAVKTYQKAARYTRRFFGENVEYAITFQNMSWALRAMGRIDDACKTLGEAERVYCHLFGPDHERTRAVRDERRRLGEITS